MNGGFFRRLRQTEIIQIRCNVFYSGTIAFQSYNVRFLAILVLYRVLKVVSSLTNQVLI